MTLACSFYLTGFLMCKNGNDLGITCRKYMTHILLTLLNTFLHHKNMEEKYHYNIFIFKLEILPLGNGLCFVCDS